MRKFFVLLAVAAGFFGAGTGSALASDDVFVVSRVPVEAQADSATTAKRIAQMEGRRRAMDILLRRLTVEEDWSYLPTLEKGEGAEAPADQAVAGAAAAPAEPPAPTYDPNAAYDPTNAPNPYVQGPGMQGPGMQGPGGVAPGFDPDAKQAITLTDNDLETLEQSFEVYSEKNSATTYRAFITYRFKPDAVRKLFKTAHIPYSETQTRTALVLPVLQTDNGVYLWESNNPWMAAWKERPLDNELTPMTAPLGDLQDAAIITAKQALSLDQEKLAAIADYYSVSQVIVAHARLKQANGQDQLTVKLINGYRDIGPAAGDEDPGLASTLDMEAVNAPVASVAPAPTGAEAPPTPDDFAARAGDVLAQTQLAQASGDFPGLAEQSIEAAIAKYSRGWKRKTLIDHSSEAVLQTTAFFSSLSDWTKIRKGLVATPLVGSVQVFALSPSGAEMRLKVFGDPKRLTVTMENYGVDFWTLDGDRWFLATPAMASKLQGSRLLLRRRHGGLFGEDDSGMGEGPQIEPASSQPDDQAPETKIDQPF